MKYFKLSLLVLVPLLAQYATAIAVPEDALVARQQNKKGGGKGGATSTNSATGSGATGGNNAGGNNPQTSLTLDKSVIAPAFANGKGQAAGEANSLQSTNNFINFCIGKTNTNGAQVTGGSCNPAPMGDIPSSANMPSAKFQSPKNGDTIAANKAFTISMAIRGMQTGFFTNAAASYFAAPQQLNSQGQIQGHSHVVIEKLSALDQTTPTDPTKFAFFKGLNAAAVGGVLTADVTAGLPAGVYKLSSINSASNHQPVLAPIAQHGSLDDAVYFTVSGAGGNNAGNGGGAAGNPASSSSVPANPATSSPAGGKGGKGGSNGGKNTASVPANPATSTPAGGKGGKGGSNGGKNTASVPANPATSTPVGGKGGNGGKNTATVPAKPAASSPTGGNKGGNVGGNPNVGNGRGGQQKRRFMVDY